MRILFLSCHSVLEHDEYKLFSELGHEIVSQGSYRNPTKPEGSLRPPISDAYYDEKLAPLANFTWDSERIPAELIDWCDLIYIMHMPNWLKFWEKMKGKIVVWRSIGQSVPDVERVIARYRREGLRIVRYSPLERDIPGYVGEDAMIRFYKDPTEFEWNGKKRQVITFAQAMVRRDSSMKFSVFERVTRGFPRKLYGPENAEAGNLWGGFLDWEDQKAELRDSRVFFYTCTQPAQYTLSFVEAFISGIPVVAIGRGLAGYRWIETPDLIENGVSGFVSDNLKELRDDAEALLNDHDLAKRIGGAGRKTAMETFGKNKIKEQWRRFFESVR